MRNAARVPAVVLVFCSFLAASAVAVCLRAYAVGAALASAASGVAGLAFLGHLITLDDDAPDGWSNPEGVQEIWRESLRHLLLKLVALVVAVVVAAGSWMMALR